MPGRAGESVTCLGTSPAMLFEGLRRARAGARVTFIDRAEAIGGGWRTRDLFGFAGVEVGAHLFENRHNTLATLLTVMGPDELVVDEAGFGLLGRRRISLRAARALLYGGLIAKALARHDFAGLVHSAANLAASARAWRVPLVYPAGGIAPLLTRLHALLLEVGATFRLGVEIDAIEVLTDGVLARGERLAQLSDRLVVSSRAHAPVTGSERHWAELRASRVDSLVMLLDERTLAFDGYVELFSNPVIKRVRRLDVSCPGGFRPLAVFQLRRMGSNVASTARDVLAEAGRLGLVRDQRAPEALHHEVVTYRTLPAALLKQIEHAGQGRIATIATVDFSDKRCARRAAR